MLSAAECDAVRRLISDAERADGIAPVGEQVLRDLAGPAGGHLVAADPHGEVVGYLHLTSGSDGGDAAAELVVHPQARRRGIGAAMMRAAIERSGGRIRFWAHGTLPAATAAADAAGLRAVRSLTQMTRPLSDLPDTVVPQGVTVRTFAGQQDHAELLRVNNAAFDWHPEQGGWTDHVLVARLGQPWFEPEGLFLAFDDATGRLVGFHWTKIHDGNVGEVYVLGVDPAAHGRGLGRALTVVGMRHLAGRLVGGEQPEVMLYVESDNTAALATYRGLGFTVEGVDTAFAPA
ncbi:MAG: mycothiol synthase [Mycobacterium sp.]|nr:mycothiol synthase [Mycobacterium sp.]